MQVDDEYAKQFMEGEGDALYFDKRVAPPTMRWLMAAGLMAAAVGVGVATVDDPSTLWALVPLGAGGLLTVTFWSLRTLVTQRMIHVQYGIGGRKIPVADVLSVEVVDSNWVRFGGWGVRRNPITGETSYNMMGSKGRAVKIAYKGSLRNRTLYVSAENPERLRDAIRQAMVGTTAASGDALADARASLGLADAARDGVVREQPVATSVEAAVEVAERR